MRDGLLQEAMRALSPSALWKMRGWAGVPGKSCHWPNDTDRKKAACSIFTATTGKHAGCELLKDHRQGKSWDAPGLLAEVEGISLREACRLFIELAGVKPLDAPAIGSGGRRSKPEAVNPSPPRAAPPPPSFDYSVLNPQELSADDVEAIACSRGISNRAVMAVAKYGVLSNVTLTAGLRIPIPRQNLPCEGWSLHTKDFQSIRIRSYGGAFPGFEGRVSKSLTPPGATCSTPVWIGPSDAERLVICEGEADSIAAWDISLRENAVHGLAVVCIFSSSLSIPCSFLPRLAGRRVRIVPHVGDTKRQGEIAACRWAASIKPWAADVQIFSLAGLVMLDGSPVTDLGDLARCPDELLKSLKGIMSW